MDKKIILILLFLLNFGFSALTEFGRIVYFYGDVQVSRNNEIIRPILSTRVYLDEAVLVGNNSGVKIKSNFNSFVSLKDQTSCRFNSPTEFELGYGTLYFKAKASDDFSIISPSTTHNTSAKEFVYQENNLITIDDLNRPKYQWGELTDFSELDLKDPEPKSMSQALLYTAAFPGWGHLYVENPLKGIPMLIFSTYLLYNILTINPGNWQSEPTHEIMYNKKEQFQQIYLVYLGWALMDIFPETNNYNKNLQQKD